MIDVEMLDTMAKGAVPIRDGKPVFLEDVFNIVKADGWRPRNVAGVHELDGLEAGIVGVTDCLAPLVQPGDLVYYDPNMPALPGDIVHLKLSERGAKAQNGDGIPLPGQRIWRKGDPWLKLLAKYHGMDMLLTRHDGQSATATLMSCEHPEDLPVLVPVRNVSRNGHLLFTPEIHCAQVGDNAVSQMLSLISVGPFSAFGSGVPPGSPQTANLMLLSIATTGSPVGVDITLGVVQLFVGLNTTGWNLQVTVLRDGLTLSAAPIATWDSGSMSWTANSYVNANPTSFVFVDSGVAAGTHTYTVQATASCSGSGSPTPRFAFNWGQGVVKLREIKK